MRAEELLWERARQLVPLEIPASSRVHSRRGNLVHAYVLQVQCNVPVVVLTCPQSLESRLAAMKKGVLLPAPGT